jgi:hypothetical protein
VGHRFRQSRVPPRTALPSRVGIRTQNQATGLVWIGFLRPASPLRDSAGVSPDFAGFCATRRLTEVLCGTVADATSAVPISARVTRRSR